MRWAVGQSVMGVRRGAPGRLPGPRPLLASVAAQRLERRPARVDRRILVDVRLDVEILSAHRAEPGAVGTAEDLVGETQRDLVARPRPEIELPFDDVLRAELLVRSGVGRLVLPRIHLHPDGRRCEAAHARTGNRRPEAQAEDVPGRGALDDELRGDLGGARDVRLAAERERLERDVESLSVLLAGPEPQSAEGVSGHAARVPRDPAGHASDAAA